MTVTAVHPGALALCEPDIAAHPENEPGRLAHVPHGDPASSVLDPRHGPGTSHRGHSPDRPLEVMTDLVGAVEPGDVLLVHAGVAIARVEL
ncbi:MAG: hypothetical protein ACR2MU_02895 [Gaiellaceae bacterium]